MKKLLPLLFLLLPVGCEVLEEDISHDRVPVVAPADKVSVAAGTVDFRWAAVEYATGYEFTAVSPSFAAAGRVVADTVSRAGEYEWCVTGFNGGYKTPSEIRSLTVLPAEEPQEPSQSE